ncbi:hypothetical protein [Actinocorallia longicatena]|uniref:AAA domain-containing protein n=1 Tax=Actinocorallia longicatena TaxID=111803 RepID=A0ABP6QDS6_9ACTN
MRPDEREETSDAAMVQARLKHVSWIGGGSGAGKSTIARRLAAEHGLHVYSTDWVNRTPETMFETFHWFHGEGFALIVEFSRRPNASN